MSIIFIANDYLLLTVILLNNLKHSYITSLHFNSSNLHGYIAINEKNQGIESINFAIISKIINNFKKLDLHK